MNQPEGGPDTPFRPFSSFAWWDFPRGAPFLSAPVSSSQEQRSLLSFLSNPRLPAGGRAEEGRGPGRLTLLLPCTSEAVGAGSLPSGSSDSAVWTLAPSPDALGPVKGVRAERWVSRGLFQALRVTVRGCSQAWSLLRCCSPARPAAPASPSSAPAQGRGSRPAAPRPP